MARKSPWQEFAENFDAVYGTFQKIGTNIETSRIMDDERFTAKGGLGWDAKAGKALEGNALETARYKALGDIYTKYGDAEKGLQVRQQLANLEEQKRSNDLSAAIFNNQVELLGKLAVREKESEIGLNQSRIKQLDAQTQEIVGTLPYDIELIRQTAKQAGYEASDAGIQNWINDSTKGLNRDAQISELTKKIELNKGIIEAAGDDSYVASIIADQEKIISSAEKEKIELANLDAELKSKIALTGEQINQVKAVTQGLINDNTNFQEKFDAEIALLKAKEGLTANNAEEQAIRNLGLGDLLDAQIEQIVKNTELTEMSAKSQAIQNIIAEATKDTTIKAENLANDKSIAESETWLSLKNLDKKAFETELKTRIAKANSDKNAAELEVLQSAGFLKYAQNYQAGAYKTGREAADAFISIVGQFDPGRAAKLSNEYTAAEIAGIANEGLKIQNEVASLLQNQDFEGLAEYFDKKNGDDFGINITRTKDGGVSIVETGKNGNAVRTLLDSPDLATALQDAQALTTFGNAGGLAELLAGREKSQALLDKVAAEIDSIEAGTTHQEILNDTAKYTAVLQQDNLKVRSDLAIAQTQKLKQEVSQEAGLTWNDKVAQKAYNSWVTGDTYALMADSLSNDENGAQQLLEYTNMVKQGLGLIGEPPAGIPNEEWLKLSDSERAELIRLGD